MSEVLDHIDWSLSDAPAQFDELVFFYNPFSSRMARAKTVLDRLETTTSEHGLHVVSCQTSAEPNETYDMVAALTENQAAVTCVGDGSNSHLMAAMRRAGKRNPVLLLPGGRKNDLANVLGTGSLHADPLEMLLSVVAASLYPTVARVTQNGALQAETDGYSYNTVGVTADTAHRVNDRAGYRDRRIHKLPVLGTAVAERWVALEALFGAQPFTVKQEGGEPQAMLELIAANIPVMGGQFRFRVKPHEREFRLVTARDLVGCIGLVAMAGTPGVRRLSYVGETVSDGAAVTYTITGNPRMQADGEVIEMDLNRKEPFTLSFQTAETSVTVLSNRSRQTPMAA